MRLLLFALLVFPLALQAQQNTYTISFRNTTPQLLTDAVCAAHSRRTNIFDLGQTASSGLAVLAEDGASSSFASELRSIKGVRRVATGDFVGPNETATITIKARRNQRISCVLGMLVVTNDAFPAFRGARTPRTVGKKRRFKAMIYDAGSEVNTESCEHVPGGPCDAHFIGEAENGTIQPHPGIIGNADISAQRYAWPRRTLRGTITRTK